MNRLFKLPSAAGAVHGVAMSLLLLLLCMSCPQYLSAQDFPALDKKFTYKAVRKSLPAVLKDIRVITGIRFTYNVEEIEQQPAVTVDAKDMPLRDLLKQLLEKTSLTYSTGLAGIIIFPRVEPEVQSVRKGFLVSGQVTDKQGAALSGVTVQAIESKVGTNTTEDGMFFLVVLETDKLRVTRLGMKPMLVGVKQNVFAKIMMDSVIQEIREVVVNGYQVIDKRMSTAAVFKLDAADIMQPGQSTVDKMLQGKVPGLMIVNNSGSPNAVPKMRIRGTSTFIGNAAPVWVIDGVIKEDPVDLTPAQLNEAMGGAQGANFAIIGNAVSGLNPYDIESMTFLKDAAATAVYGVRAANGVIVITTKKGKSGPAQLSYNGTLTFQARPSYSQFQLMNSRQRVDLSRELLKEGLKNYNIPKNVGYESLVQKFLNKQITLDELNAGTAAMESINTDWFSSLFRPALSSSHSLSLTGGNEKTNYYTSFNYANNGGAAKEDGNKQYSVLLNLHGVLSKRLTIDIGANASYIRSSGYYNLNPFDYAVTASRTIDKDLLTDAGLSDELHKPLTYNFANEINQSTNTATTTNTMLTASLNYQVSRAWKWNTLLSGQLGSTEGMQAAYDRSNMISAIRRYDFGEAVTDSMRKSSPLPYGGIANINHENMVALNMRNQLEYNRAVFGARDRVSIMVGNEIKSLQRKGFSSVELGYFPDRGQTFFSDEYNVGGNATKGSTYYHKPIIVNTLNNNMGFYAAATYCLMGKYVLSVTGRADGSNRFGQYSNQRFLPNMVFSGSWDAGRESWLSDSRIISGLRFHASYGTQGNVVDQVGPELIASYPSSPIDPGSGEYILHTKSLAYPNLRWEKTYQSNGGVELSLFNGRIIFNAEAYMKKSVDLLATKELPFEYGINNMVVNAGNMTNSGFDLFLQVVPLRTDKTEISCDFTYAKNYNNIVSSQYANLYTNYLAGNALIPGKPINSLWSYAYAGLDHNTGIPRFSNTGTFKGANADPASFLVYSGRKDPLITMGFNPRVRYGAFTLNLNMYVSYGNYKRLNPIYGKGIDGGAPLPSWNMPVLLAQRWRKPGDEAFTDVPAFGEERHVPIPSLESGEDVYKMYDLSDLRVVNASFLRCRTVNIFYRLSSGICRQAGVKGVNIGGAISNPFTIASKKLLGQDPETLGTGSTALPVTRSYSFTLNVMF